MGKQSNLHNQARHQYNFLNPDNKKNLHLNQRREWTEVSAVDYEQDNKEMVKLIAEDVKSIKQEIRQQVEEKKNGKFNSNFLILISSFTLETPFKMERWKNVEPKI